MFTVRIKSKIDAYQKVSPHVLQFELAVMSIWTSSRKRWPA